MASSKFSLLCYVIGLVTLSHSAYSVKEFAYLSKHTSDVKLLQVWEIPTDIIIETLLGMLVIVITSVISTEDFKPVAFSTWSAEKEKSGEGTYDYLERRPGFLNLSEKRKEFGNK